MIVRDKGGHVQARIAVVGTPGGFPGALPTKHQSSKRHHPGTAPTDDTRHHHDTPIVLAGYISAGSIGGSESIDAISHYISNSGDYGTPPFITGAEGLSSVIHHELFHTPELGDLVDPPGEGAYDWDNMVESGDMSAPDWYAFMGLLVEFMDRGVRVTAEGDLELAV